MDPAPGPGKNAPTVSPDDVSAHTDFTVSPMRQTIRATRPRAVDAHLPAAAPALLWCGTLLLLVGLSLAAASAALAQDGGTGSGLRVLEEMVAGHVRTSPDAATASEEGVSPGSPSGTEGMAFTTTRDAGTNVSGTGADAAGAAVAEPSAVPADTLASDVSDGVTHSWNGLYRCIETLPEEQKRKASAIVDDSLPRLRALDRSIMGKVDELKAVTYSNDADPEALPKLGLDLQKLRDEMRAVLVQVNLRLQKEAGVQLMDPAGRGCQSMRVHYYDHGHGVR